MARRALSAFVMTASSVAVPPEMSSSNTPALNRRKCQIVGLQLDFGACPPGLSLSAVFLLAFSSRGSIYWRLDKTSLAVVSCFSLNGGGKGGSSITTSLRCGVFGNNGRAYNSSSSETMQWGSDSFSLKLPAKSPGLCWMTQCPMTSGVWLLR